MSPEENYRSAVFSFFGANAAYIALLIAALSSGTTVGASLFGHWIISVVALLALETATAGIIWLLFRRPSPTSKESLFPKETIDHLCLRFATADDFEATENVYHEWFPRSISIDDAEARIIFGKRTYVRVIETVTAAGATHIVGFYALWLLAHTTFESLVSGTIKEKAIKAADLVLPGSPTPKVIYISEICISNDSQIGAALLRDAVRYVGKLLDDDPAILGLGAWEYSEIGKLLAKRYCMTQRKRGNGQLTEFYDVGRDVAQTIPKPKDQFRPLRRISL
jgi:hypothetical protein